VAAVDIVNEDHCLAFVRVTLAARRYTRPAADAARRVEKDTLDRHVRVLPPGSAHPRADTRAGAGHRLAVAPGELEHLRVEVLGPLRWPLCFHGGCGADLILRDLVHRLQYRICQDVGRLRAAVVIRDEERVGPDRAHDEGRSGHLTAARTYRHPISFGD